VGLSRFQWPLACWECGLSSRPGPWMSLVSVVCCQVEASASGWSLVQRLTECDHKASIKRPWPTRDCYPLGGKKMPKLKSLTWWFVQAKYRSYSNLKPNIINFLAHRTNGRNIENSIRDSLVTSLKFRRRDSSVWTVIRPWVWRGFIAGRGKRYFR
jgi:hypothetical protein